MRLVQNSIVRTLLAGLILPAMLFCASKTELELRALAAAANATAAARAKENASLQESLKTAATASAQLAAALRDKKALQASLDALAAKAQAQQDQARAAAGVAAQLAAQLAAQTASKNRADLTKALEAAAANNKRQADVANRQRSEAAATVDANAAEAQRVAGEQKAAADLAAEKAAKVATGQKKQGDEIVKLSTHTDFASYANLITASSGIVIFVSGLWFKNRADVRIAAQQEATAIRVAERQADAAERDHRWLVEATAQAAAETARHRALELEKIAEAALAAKLAYHEANNVNAKIAEIGLKMADGAPLKPEVVAEELAVL
jgi:hypothetical protein